MIASRNFAFVVFVLMIITTRKIVQGAVPVIPPPPPVFITIRVTQEKSSEVHLLWKSSAFSKNILGTCTLHYGPISANKTFLLPFSPEESYLRVKGLVTNVTYRGYITCQNGRFILPSDTVHFTPREHENHKVFHPIIPSQSLSSSFQSNPKNKIQESSSQRQRGKESSVPFLQDYEDNKSTDSDPVIKDSSSVDRRMQDDSQVSPETPKLGTSRHLGVSPYSSLQNSRHLGVSPYSSLQNSNEGVLVIMSQRHMDGIRKDHHSSKRSTSIILGVICGVVGFVIINITVVIVVRQYSLRRDRQRRLFELQLEQHGGFIYNIEDILNA